MAPRKPARPASKAPARRPAGRKAAARKAPAKPAAARRAKPAPRRARRKDPETLRLRGIEPTFTVDDVQKSLGFYTDVVGFVVDERWTNGDVLLGVSLKAGVCKLGLSQDDWKKGRDRKKGEGMRLWCETGQDVDALAARVRKAGGQLRGDPSDEPWGGRSVTLVDPDGFVLTFYRPARAS